MEAGTAPETLLAQRLLDFANIVLASLKLFSMICERFVGHASALFSPNVVYVLDLFLDVS